MDIKRAIYNIDSTFLQMEKEHLDKEEEIKNKKKVKKVPKLNLTKQGKKRTPNKTSRVPEKTFVPAIPP